MHDISDYLTADHHHCDDLFAEAENAVANDDWQTAMTQFKPLKPPRCFTSRVRKTYFFPPSKSEPASATAPPP
jgi:hypothetical protein